MSMLFSLKINKIQTIILEVLNEYVNLCEKWWICDQFGKFKNISINYHITQVYG